MSYLDVETTSTRLRAHFAGIQQDYPMPDEGRINPQSPPFSNIWFTPSTDGQGAFQDPTHVGFWNSNSFWNYTRPEQAKFISSSVLFESNRVKNFYPTDWHREHQIVCVKGDLLR